MRKKGISSDTLPKPRPPLKELVFCAGTVKEFLAFPKSIIKEAGYQLDQVQREIDNWKSFDTVGPGVCQMSIDGEKSWYRVMYIAKFPEAVYVLHCFQKKSNQTAEGDIEIARKRLSVLKQERRKKGLK